MTYHPIWARPDARVGGVGHGPDFIGGLFRQQPFARSVDAIESVPMVSGNEFGLVAHGVLMEYSRSGRVAFGATSKDR